MSVALKVALAQLPVHAGDLDGNVTALLDAAYSAYDAGARVLLAPEMFLPGYVVDDLLGDPDFILSLMTATRLVARRAPRDMLVLFGTALPVEFLSADEKALLDPVALDAKKRTLVNALVAVKDGQLVHLAVKSLLPTYGVFDDARWFVPAAHPSPLLEVDGIRLGLAVCEDVWDTPVVDALAAAGADVLLVANASPFTVGKPALREQLMAEHASRTQLPAVYVNLVGGQDELVYDGSSFAVDATGAVFVRLPAFTPAVEVVTVPLAAGSPAPAPLAPILEEDESIYRALVTALRDYVNGSGLTGGVILGLSGGLDSALAATIAVDALGPEAVRGVLMPGPYSSEHSITDAQDLAANLGLGRVDVLGISSVFDAEVATLGPLLAGPGVAVATENIQARARALHLMTLANATGAMVINTGNKSEASVGYFTLGGDSSGGFAILKDVYKTKAYSLAYWRNAQAEAAGKVPPIPVSTLEKPPSAELAADQQDTDSLPPYPIMDATLVGLLEERTTRAILARELELVFELPSNYSSWEDLVARVSGLLARAEHKRRQVAPGVKVTERAYGRDRRYPIVNAFTGS